MWDRSQSAFEHQQEEERQQRSEGLPSRPQRAVQEVPAGDERGDPTRCLVLRAADTVPEDMIIIT